MGANTSSIADGESPALKLKLKLGEIPESCMALILSYLDPPEICKLAGLNRAFRSASSADFIWESKLPSNYRYVYDELLERSFGELGKKELYAKLSKPVSFDGGTKEIWVDKRSGGVCLSISSKAMRITGIDDRRYWNHIQSDESRFQTVAYLQQIWWLEVDGDIKFQFPAGTYSLLFKLQLGRATKRLGRRVCNPENVHGWDVKPVQFKLTVPDCQHAVSRCYLDKLGNWEYYHVGDFVVEDPYALTKVKFSLTQIDCTHSKGGLCLDSVLICPNSLAKDIRSLQ